MTQEYIGRKIVTAWRNDAPQGEGYSVKYSDGYISWCPKDKFDEANIPLGNIAHLPPFHQRLIAEQAVNASDLSKLDAFIRSESFAQLGDKMADLMVEQLGAMTHLDLILKCRLDLLIVPE